MNLTPRLLIYSIVLSVFFVPGIPTGSFLPDVRLEEIIVFSWAVIVLLMLLAGFKIGLSLPSGYLLLGLAFTSYVFLSVWWGGVLGYGTTIRDFMEVVKAIKYLLIFTIVVTAIQRGIITREQLLGLISIAGVITVIIAFTQYINLFGLNAYYVPYIAPTQYHTLVGNYPWPRVVGLTGNPNEYAALVTLASLAALFLAIYYRKRMAYVLWIILVAGVAMTLSRSGFAFLVVSSLTILFGYLWQVGWRFRDGQVVLNKTVPLIIVFFIISSAIAGLLMPDEFYWRMGEGLNLSESTSWVARVDNWGERMSVFKSSWIIGVGPAKSIEFQHAADNEWLLLGMRYGILGVILCLAWWLSPLCGRSDSRRLHNSRIYITLYGAAVVGSFVYMIPAAIYHSLQVFPIILMYAAIVVPAKGYILKL